jgi:glutamine synthetase adenylyltransferase
MVEFADLSTVSLNFHFQSTGEIRRIFTDFFADGTRYDVSLRLRTSGLACELTLTLKRPLQLVRAKGSRFEQR